MGMHQKAKSFLTHLSSKGATLFKSSHQVGAKIAYIPPEVVELKPPAWACDSVIGVFTTPQGYDDSVLRVYMPDPLGAYDNR